MANPIQCVVRSCANTTCRRNRQPRPTEAVSTGWRYLLGGAAEQYEFLCVAAVQRQFHDSRSFHDLTDADAARFPQPAFPLTSNRFGSFPALGAKVIRRLPFTLRTNAGLRK